MDNPLHKCGLEEEIKEVIEVNKFLIEKIINLEYQLERAQSLLGELVRPSVN